jgi:hypothetical protein
MEINVSQPYRFVFLYDVYVFRQAIKEFLSEQSDIDILLAYYLEQTLFVEVGLNVVWTVNADQFLYQGRVLMESDLPRTALHDTFRLADIPDHLKAAECYLVIDHDTVAISYP